MVEMGLLAAEQAKDHPDANVVTRALGYSQLADGTVIEADVKIEPLNLQARRLDRDVLGRSLRRRRGPRDRRGDARSPPPRTRPSSWS
jgi:hypothetical protein